jgi:hypothetical protein
MLARTLTALFFALNMTLSAQQPFVSNLDEDKVGKLPIPDVLTGTDGKKITTKEDWLAKRRPELMKLFETEQYGKTPEGKPPGIRYVVTSEDKKALGGKATKREVTIFFTDKEEPHADMLIYIPNVRKQPAPMFVSLNFHGNQSVIKDPAIKLPMVWNKDKTTKAWTCTRAEEASRGDQADRWPIAEIIERGYGVATAYYCDFEPDTPEGLAKGVRPLYYLAGQNQPEPNEWGSIGAWAWGLSRMADYLQLLPEVDGNKLAVLGHSRLGKAALWAGAQDERFTIVISNDSGAGGAALSKRIFGETVEHLPISLYPPAADAEILGLGHRRRIDAGRREFSEGARVRGRRAVGQARRGRRPRERRFDVVGLGPGQQRGPGRASGGAQRFQAALCTPRWGKRPRGAAAIGAGAGAWVGSDRCCCCCCGDTSSISRTLTPGRSTLIPIMSSIIAPALL